MQQCKIEPICNNCGQCCDSYSFWLTNRDSDNDDADSEFAVRVDYSFVDDIS